jgi:hypothetical protein
MEKAQAQAIFDRMELLGIAKITAKYSGSEDSGQFDGFECFDKNGALVDELLLDKPLGEDEQLRKVTARIMNAEDKKFTEELEQAAWDAVDGAGQGGFHNNEGGEGTLNFDLAERRIWLTHANNTYTDRETDKDGEPLNDDEPDRTLGDPVGYEVYSE